MSDLLIRSVIFFSLFGILIFNPCKSMEADAYQVGPEDGLKVTILGKQDYKLTEDLTVSSTGTVLLSIIREPISIEGMTILEVDAALTKKLSEDYLVNPEVIVEISKFQSHKVLVIGEVKSPGEIVLQKESLSLKELLMQTGGSLGDMNKTVMILRQSSESATKPIVISLDEAIMAADTEELAIKKNDVVYILGKDKTLPMQDFSSVVYVFGEVSKPGLVSYNQNMTALRAIISAGNFTKEASPSRTVIKRREGSKLKTIDVDMNDVMIQGDKSKDVILQPGDIIYVPRAIF